MNMREIRLIIGGICMLMSIMLSSCCEPVEMWTISNNATFSIQVINTYVKNNEIFVEDAQIGPFQGIFIASGDVTDVKSFLSRDWAFSERPNLTLCFVPCFKGLDEYPLLQRCKFAAAYLPLNEQWMNNNNWNINFPEDCTVNPDLWKIYDLDKFVELYGPLNAKGWDEVWQKWEESKLSGEEDSKLSGEDVTGLSGEEEPGVSGEGEIERAASLSL